MKKKDIMDSLISKVPEDQKEAFVAELREAKTKDNRMEVLKKYNAILTDEEKQKLASDANKLTDEELDQAAGGCGNCNCNCDCECSCC